MTRISRIIALKTAAVISFLLSAINLFVSLTFVVQGAAAVNQGADGPPYFVELVLFVISVLGLIAAYGTWKQMRWGILLTIIINGVNLLSAAPGVLFAPRPWGLIASAVTILLSATAIVLCLLPDRRPALESNSVQ
jgi:hypothetical protein